MQLTKAVVKSVVLIQINDIYFPKSKSIETPLNMSMAFLSIFFNLDTK